MVVLPRPLSVQVAHLCVTWWIHLRRVLYFACRLGIDTRPRDDARVYPLCDLLGDERAALVGSQCSRREITHSLLGTIDLAARTEMDEPGRRPARATAIQ